MPCYLFTYHAYGSWLPDRSRGYVKRGRGILPTDERLAMRYRRKMKGEPVVLDCDLQRTAIDSLLESAEPQRFTLHAAASDATHLHSLLSWRDQRAAAKLRALLRGSLTRRFNRCHGRRSWWAEGGSRKQVRERRHFNHLLANYLPKHAGWKWDWRRGWYD